MSRPGKRWNTGCDCYSSGGSSLSSSKSGACGERYGLLSVASGIGFLFFAAGMVRSTIKRTIHLICPRNKSDIISVKVISIIKSSGIKNPNTRPHKKQSKVWIVKISQRSEDSFFRRMFSLHCFTVAKKMNCINLLCPSARSNK